MLTRALNRILALEANPYQLAVVRIGFGGVVVLKAVDIFVRLAALPASGSRPRYIDALPELLFAGSTWLLTGAWAACGVALVLGFRPRIAALVTSLLATYLLLADQRLFNQHLYLMGLLGLLFGLSRCDAALALGAVREAPRPIPGWPVFLMKAQLSIVYAFAALSKVNVNFLSGAVINAAAMNRALGPSLVPDAIRDSLELNVGLAVLTILIEGLLSFGLWLPRLRPLSLTVGTTFHAGLIILTPSSAFHAVRLGVFSLLLLILYPLFITAPLGAHRVHFDPADERAQRWVRWLGRLDWVRTLRFTTRPPLSDRLVLIDADGRQHRGTKALLRAFAILPLTCFAAAIWGLLSWQS